VNSIARLMALSFLVVVLGCSSSTAPAADAAADSGLVSCFVPLATDSGFCAGSLVDQVAGNPCNDFSTTTESTCGHYQLWRSKHNPPIAPGFHVCIYDNNQAGALVGAKTCGTPDQTCTDGCVEYGAVLLSQVTNCGPETDLCSPPP